MMRDVTYRNDRKRLRSFIYSVPVAIILVALTVVTARATVDMYGKWREAEDLLVEVQVKHDDLREAELALVGRLDRLDGDLGIESQIRDTFGMTREGEEVVVIIDDESVIADNSGTTTQEKGFWQTIGEWFE